MTNLGGNDERENTLNQLLVEMDGFGTDRSGILLILCNVHMHRPNFSEHMQDRTTSPAMSWYWPAPTGPTCWTPR